MLLDTGISRLMEEIYLPQTIKSTFREISSLIGNEPKSTGIAGRKFVWSSESAPILIHGGSPANFHQLRTIVAPNEMHSEPVKSWK
jgi:hypothetical protein